MASTNADSMTPAQGEFMPHVPRDQPLTTSGHKPGVKASPADRAPEFHAQTLPPGTAPADRTFAPNPQGEIPGQANNEDAFNSDTYTAPSDTLMGATSADVNTGYGHPGSGMTSSELHHNGEHHRNRAGAGLEGVGAGSGRSIVNERVTESQRGLERDEAQSGRHGDKGTILAEDRIPESAESVAAERSYRGM